MEHLQKETPNKIKEKKSLNKEKKGENKETIIKELNNLIGRKEIKPNYRILRNLEFSRKKQKKKNGCYRECKEHPFCDRNLLINDTIPKRDITYVVVGGVGGKGSGNGGKVYDIFYFNFFFENFL